MQFIRITAIIMLIKLNIFSAVYAQTAFRIDDDKVFNASRFGRGYISLSNAHNYLLQLQSFKNITVIDARPDTFAIGFRRHEIEIRRKLLQFENGLNYQLSAYVPSITIFSRDSSAWSLIIVVKDFWLKEYDIDEEETDKMLNRKYLFQDDIRRESDLTIQFDCYIHKSGNYYALFRFDTVINKFIGLPRFSKKYIEYTLQMGLHKAENLNIDSVTAKKKKLALEDINTYYRQRRNFPVLSDTILRKGVYNNFEEFKTNRPTITDFELKKGKLADILYADGKPTRNVWGYCDGYVLFIKTGENYYPLIRQGDSYYFLGSTEINRSKGGYSDPYGTNGHPYFHTHFKNVLLPMKLNWQSGKAY